MIFSDFNVLLGLSEYNTIYIYINLITLIDVDSDFLFCRELGIGIVPYSPIGRGFLAVGPKVVENMIEGDFRKVRIYVHFYRIIT